ncbi:MAG: hypothetical protein V1977_04450 [Candidatus Diapherotrites archaeon]
MGFWEWLKQTLGSQKQASGAGNVVYEALPGEEEIHTLWDYLQLLDNTQASHVVKVLGFEEWVSMEEIRRRIEELFGVHYENDRSLYPYIKTLVDCGLLEISNVGGKRKWRKKELLIRLKAKKKEEIKAELRVA